MDSQQWDERYSGTEFEWTMQPNQFVAAELAGLLAGPSTWPRAKDATPSGWPSEAGG